MNKLRASGQIQEKDRYIRISEVKRQMVTMLEELQQEIDEKATELCDDGWWLTYNNLIQEKIDKLGENENESG